MGKRRDFQTGDFQKRRKSFLRSRKPVKQRRAISKPGFGQVTPASGFINRNFKEFLTSGFLYFVNFAGNY
jgi:hypothetical protein